MILVIVGSSPIHHPKLREISSVVELRCYIPRVEGSIPSFPTRLLECSLIGKTRGSDPHVLGSSPGTPAKYGPEAKLD